tara:strand:- start:779 stop:910 length:132 start_codon:yes stop_codon:yes gene_type:complete
MNKNREKDNEKQEIDNLKRRISVFENNTGEQYGRMVLLKMWSF